MRNGREHVVSLSADKFKRMRRPDREVLRVEDFTAADLEAICKAEPPLEVSGFNHEMPG